MSASSWKIFQPVLLLNLDEILKPSVVETTEEKIDKNCVIVALNLDPKNSALVVQKGEVELHRSSAYNVECCLLEENCLAVRPESSNRALILRFPSAKDAQCFADIVKEITTSNASKSSVFEQRTEESSSTQYFQFYGYLSQQQNMLQDYVRTYTYQRAVLSNLGDFKDKVVLDVGAGSGILSFFAAQAGARKVYAVEASSMAQHCEALVKHNQLENRISVIAGKIEEIQIPELVDTIISEPMGYMLLNERMLETFLHAKKFLKPKTGKMFPSRGDLHIAPFTDESLYLEQCGKANFWYQECFHGVNLSALRLQALKEYFKQPVVDTFHVGILLAPSVVWTLDFLEKDEASLHNIEIPLQFVLQQTAFIHGLAFWFDVAFIGSEVTVWLSTAPTEPLTHWYQVRCLLEQPLWGVQGSVVVGKVVLSANKRQSYDVDLELTCNGRTSGNSLDLKNPCFRYTGQAVQPPPGMQTVSPTEAYYAQMAAAAAVGQTENGSMIIGGAGGVPMMNGVVAAADGVALPHAAATASPTVGNFITLLPSGQPAVAPSAPLVMGGQRPAAVEPQNLIFGQQQPISFGNYLMTGLSAAGGVVGQSTVVPQAPATPQTSFSSNHVKM